MPSTINAYLQSRGEEPREMELWCQLEQHDTQHYCMFCREGLFRSRLRVVAVMIGNGVQEPFLTAPVSMQCHKCGCIYHLRGFSE